MTLRKLLAKFKGGEMSVEQVEVYIEGLREPWRESSETLSVGTTARLDPGRAARSGVPEAVFAEGKRPQEVVEFLRLLATENGCALATRVTRDLATLAVVELEDTFTVDFNEHGRTLVVQKQQYEPDRLGRLVGILAAGTADIPAAEEARVTAQLMGCEVITAYDVGVAGIHRLFGPIREMREEDVDAIIVVAGMEGALPTVVKGLVAVPVFGVPTSTGYGYGGKGEGALMTMLQSCSPGLTVVNIDNGFGAAAAAALVAKRAASVEQSASQDRPTRTIGSSKKRERAYE